MKKTVCRGSRMKHPGHARNHRKSRGKTRSGKPAGRNVTNAVTEAARILREMGFITGKIDDPDLPFDLVASAGRTALFVKAVRPRSGIDITNAQDVKEHYTPEIREMEPFWESNADDLQFWIISKQKGLLRYRVFRGGIWNVDIMEKENKTGELKGTDLKTEETGLPEHKSRTARCPERATGLA